LQVSTVKVGTGRKAKNMTGLVLQFSGALNPAQAQNLAAYQLLSGKVKKSRTTFNKTVLLSSAIYSASAHTVTLIPRSRLNLAQPEQLRITGSLLTDSLGRSLDVNYDGQPGGDLVAIIKGKTVTMAAISNTRAASLSRLELEAIDRVLAGDAAFFAGPLRSTDSPPKRHAATRHGQAVKVVSPGTMDLFRVPPRFV
jgi:hypothetical protein